ncbi:hypothetical protein Pint_25936 [Pistacia integerrima]|uniref:Uncharacterized protein n=1 Tax=Pistacia integerrima TaxID=434235 RepID=A0ACC0YEW1_9ROSI|nr:hypothetical protein Pint_25936 [Pistacia integerrima]
MNIKAFEKLCSLLQRERGLKSNRNTSVEEMVCSFLHICAHHIKNRVLSRQLDRSGETVSRNFHVVLNAVLRMHTILLKEPKPITEDSTDERWKWFKVHNEDPKQYIMAVFM